MLIFDSLMQMQILNKLQKPTISKLAQYSYLKTYKKGEYVFRDQDENSKIYIILSGMVSIYKLNQKYDKKIIFVLGKGDFINEESLNDLFISSYCQVLQNATVICIPKKKLLEVMEEDFELTKIMLSLLSHKVRRLYRQLKNTTGTVRIDKKLASKLWKLSKDYGLPCESGTYINLDLSITFLAEMLGSTRETISRQIKILSDKNIIIVKNNKFIIPNKNILANYFKST